MYNLYNIVLICITFLKTQHQVWNSNSSTRVNSLVPSKAKSSLFKTPEPVKRRAPINGFTNACQFAPKMQKLEDEDSEQISFINSWDNKRENTKGLSLNLNSKANRKYNKNPSFFNYISNQIIEEEEEEKEEWIVEENLWNKVK